MTVGTREILALRSRLPAMSIALAREVLAASGGDVDAAAEAARQRLVDEVVSRSSQPRELCAGWLQASDYDVERALVLAERHREANLTPAQKRQRRIDVAERTLERWWLDYPPPLKKPGFKRWCSLLGNLECCVAGDGFDFWLELREAYPEPTADALRQLGLPDVADALDRAVASKGTDQAAVAELEKGLRRMRPAAIAWYREHVDEIRD
jgi:hypothetical protein